MSCRPRNKSDSDEDYDYDRKIVISRSAQSLQKDVGYDEPSTSGCRPSRFRKKKKFDGEHELHDDFKSEFTGYDNESRKGRTSKKEFNYNKEYKKQIKGKGIPPPEEKK